MNAHCLLLLLLFFQAASASAQDRFKDAARILTSADSVVLISHVTIDEYHGKPDIQVPPLDDTQATKPMPFPSLFAGAGVNPAVVVQRRRLSKADATALAALVSKRVKPARVAVAPQCFDPHHAVLVYKRGRLSYLELCFHCQQLATSKDFRLDNMDFRGGKWERLQRFFEVRGLTYEMPEPLHRF